VGIINPTFSDIAMVAGNGFLAESDILHLHSVLRHSTMHGRITTWMHALTPQMTPASDKHLVIEFHVCVCARWAACWDLPRISS